MYSGHTMLSQPGMMALPNLCASLGLDAILPPETNDQPYTDRAPAAIAAFPAPAANVLPNYLAPSAADVQDAKKISHVGKLAPAAATLPSAALVHAEEAARKNLDATIESIFGPSSRAAEAAYRSAYSFIDTAPDRMTNFVADHKLGILALTAATVLTGCNLDLDPKTSEKLPSILFDALAFKTFGGLGLFFWGLDSMENGLKKAAADRMKTFLATLTKNRLAGLATGTVGTAMWQSSSVTTVMLVGLVSAGMMNLHQAMSVVFGANIGTTMTGWLFAIKLTKYALPITGVGAFTRYFIAKKVKSAWLENVGQAVAGIGLVFLGLNTMSSGFKDPVVKEVLKTLFTHFSGESHLHIGACILIAAVATEIVQSSSATLGVIIALSLSGVIPFETAVGLVLGINIGTTITAVLAAMKPGTPRAAQRVAATHVGFNLIGAAMVFAVAPQYIHGISYVADEIGMTDITKKVAFSHTAFNIVMSALFMMVLGPYRKIIERILPDRKGEKDTYETALSPALIDTPTLALAASRKDILRMNDTIMEMLGDLGALYTTIAETGRAAERTIEENRERIERAENVLDRRQTEIFDWLTDVMQRSFRESLAREIDSQRTIADQMETISDRLRDIAVKLVKWHGKKFSVSPAALKDLTDLHERVTNFLTRIGEALAANGTHNDQGFWDEAVRMRNDLSERIKKLEKRHNKRLRKNIRQEVKGKIEALQSHHAPPPPPTSDLDPSEEREAPLLEEDVSATALPEGVMQTNTAEDTNALPTLIKVESPESLGSTFHMDILSFYRGIVDRAINVADALAGKR